MRRLLGRINAGLALVGLMASMASALELSTNQDSYFRYEVVTLSASLGQSETAQAFPRVLKARVFKDQQWVTGPGDLKTVPLRRDPATGAWKGYWPIPFNPPLGTYQARLSVLTEEGTTVTAGAEFRVKGGTPAVLPAGFSVVTDEGGKRGPYATPGLSPDEPPSYKNMIRWADAMGADAFWECIGQSQVWKELRKEQFPWPAGSLSLAKKAGQAAHDAGMKYGAWITAYVVIGDNPRASGYEFTQGYDVKTGMLKTLRYVSLGCEKRFQDIAGLLKQFEAMPEVDYLGLDYMRTDFGGYEFASEFVRDMSIPVPADWERTSPEEQSRWMGRLIQVKRDPAARARWEWWRAHKVALLVRRLVEEVKPTKPLWVFSLGWETGHQHGQDVAMMMDAGIGFNAPMFYSIAKPDFPNMLSDWAAYLKQAEPSLVVGECVDWNLLGRTTSPSGPQEHFDRQVQTVKRFFPLAKHLGLFWHDVARAHFGARGPYGAWEWALAGAASFSRLKAEAGRLSYRLTLIPPEKLRLGETGEIRVEIANATSNSLNAVSVELLPLPRLEIQSPAIKTIRDLGPGQRAHVRMHARTSQIFEKNGGWQMLAVKAHAAGDAARDPWVEFAYVPVVAAEPSTPAAQGAARETR